MLIENAVNFQSTTPGAIFPAGRSRHVPSCALVGQPFGRNPDYSDEVAHVGQSSGYGGGGGHRRADQVRARARALTTDEVAVRG